MLHSSRERSLSYQLGGGYHRLNWQGDDEFADLTQDVYFLSAAADATRVWDQLRIAADSSVRFEAGSIDSDTFTGQDSEYWLLNLSGFAWRPLDLPLLPGEQKLSVELNSQLANSQLPSSKRMALGGTLANRAFRRDAYLVDSGALLRFDLRTPVRVGELSVFADAAYGETLNDLDENWAYLSGFGVAWSFRLAGIESRLSWAVPISSDGSGEVDDDGNQIFWSFSYRR
jgi:hemolysin activation/secretion protein